MPASCHLHDEVQSCLVAWLFPLHPPSRTCEVPPRGCADGAVSLVLGSALPSGYAPAVLRALTAPRRPVPAATSAHPPRAPTVTEPQPEGRSLGARLPRSTFFRRLGRRTPRPGGDPSGPSSNMTTHIRTLFLCLAHAFMCFCRRVWCMSCGLGICVPPKSWEGGPGCCC